ncbi:DUF1659 domain-containing protein [Metabacillus fastidiosus]|uniref:DUF1659 domain-containing protein n=1 Tax=Metabacillus fastidiosus TaxID=1458 RepID=UPI002E24951B|nr:DUF1659 domain-containing protein [Metabacillus fastidiosus]
MPVKKSLMTRSLVLLKNEGIDENGKSVLKRYTYPHINEGATNDSLFAAGNALASLYKGTTPAINTLDNSLLYQ